MSVITEGADASSDATGRKILVRASIIAVLVGLMLAFWPFFSSLKPAADTEALASVTVDMASIPVGRRVSIVWRNMPVFVAHRTDAEIRQAQDVARYPLRYPEEADADRILDPHWLVVMGIGTGSGPIPLGQKPSDPRGEWGGWWDPIGDGQYDTSGRIRSGRGVNLGVPPYAFDGYGHIVIGAQGGPKAAVMAPAAAGH